MVSVSVRGRGDGVRSKEDRMRNSRKARKSSQDYRGG